MDNINNSGNLVESELEGKSSKRKGKPARRWREIEALKDQYELKKELCDIDIFQGYDLKS